MENTENKFIVDNLGDKKSAFIKKVIDIVETLVRTEFKDMEQVAKSIIVVAADEEQTVAAGIGTPASLQFAAEALVDEPKLGGLMTFVVTAKMLKERFPEPEPQRPKKGFGDPNVN